MTYRGHRVSGWKTGTTWLLVLAVAACGYRPFVPGGEPDTPTVRTEPGYREVRAGDTLYSIAWEAGLDYRDVAAWNNIPPPYLIKPGQKIRLQTPPGGTDKALPGRNVHTVTRGETLYSIAQRYGLSVHDLAARNDIPPPYVIRPGQTLRLDVSAAAAAAVRAPSEEGVSRPRTPAPAVEQSKTTRERAARVGPWVWPAQGEILERFSPTGPNKGIDIGGRLGQPVLAAAPGTVVYQGSGLRGYGQLIIIKHDADFVSAYAHNNKIYVQEGDVVKGGQKIAEMGNSGTDRVKLHFEIRYRGVPVDPLDHLPKR